MKEILVQNCQSGMIYLTYPRWEELPALGHGFSTRSGGFSAGPFASLNLGFKGGDDPLLVKANRARFLGEIWHKEEEQLFSGEQVHGRGVIVVDENVLRAGRQVISSTDALVTARKDVLLGGFSADCLLVLFLDLSGGVVGVAHAGWRGTLQGILAGVVNVMTTHFQSRLENIQCLLGPCIKPCCYEIGEEVERLAATSPWAGQVIFRRASQGGRLHLDLTNTNRNILLASGIKARHIVASQYCTCCNRQLFYSYRRARGGPTGSLLGLVYLAGDSG